MARYVRFAALGDSSTFGIGDPVPGGWRGWARLLADGLATAYDVSFCNAAVSGATAAAVRRDQLGRALAHRPTLASLVVGVNDTLTSTWDPAQVREDLLVCAEALTEVGATLMTPRFHDHGSVLGLPGFLRRPLGRRIDALNRVWDEVHAAYGGVRLDLATCPEVHDRATWSIDRMHPSERGHRLFAHAWAHRLQEAGLVFEPPSLEPSGGIPPSWRRDLAWVVGEGAPWVGRRARDLGPWAVRWALVHDAAGPVRAAAGR
ncbi:SGNH/GDSL hydrolase family protein [Nocardioides panacihumi]|uniref:SGNH/GDSL hydrolase family protein n=1 Tax=Nocardioides panacihumi TaxID=400774 RepID=A0ABN2R6G5_9ACTN